MSETALTKTTVILLSDSPTSNPTPLYTGFEIVDDWDGVSMMTDAFLRDWEWDDEDA